MNKIQVGLAIALVGITLYIGGLVYYEMIIEIENNPDIKEIGGPPVITDLRCNNRNSSHQPQISNNMMTVVTIVACIFCGIVLKMKSKEEDVN